LAKELWALYVKHPKEVERAKVKEPSVHLIEFGNESGIFTMQVAKENKPKGFHKTKFTGLA
jgi:hypothetical protein